MRLYILGICGTFMGSLAILAKAQGYQISGSDQSIFPPMSDQLIQHNIPIYDSDDLTCLKTKPDLIIIGNALSRGDPQVEYILNENIPFTSGPAFLSVLLQEKSRWVLAVSGTHGKTTTASILAHILEYAGLSPGFLIGGVPNNFNISARLGDTPHFIIEADEYDTAFFDKRSKFIHYHPRTLIINNIEFDHADIFENLSAIQQQFHHLIRTVPSKGRIIYPNDDANILATIKKGCWSETVALHKDWCALSVASGYSAFQIKHNNRLLGEVHWTLTGKHNAMNALAAIVAAEHIGIQPAIACEALCSFQSVKRRMELIATINNISIYDDFAHHPTAIASTLKGVREKLGPKKRIIAIIECASNTMQLGIHKNVLSQAVVTASEVLWYHPKNADWLTQSIIDVPGISSKIMRSIEAIITYLKNTIQSKDTIIIMSNSHFGNIHSRLCDMLKHKQKNDNKSSI